MNFERLPDDRAYGHARVEAGERVLEDHLHFGAQGFQLLLRQGCQVDGGTTGSEVDIAGGWIQEQENQLLNITEFSEKPTIDYAQNSLRIAGLPNGEYLTVFGQYIIKPQIFDYLEEHITHNVREAGEFQLTSALDRLRQEDGFLGLVVDGQRYDIGLPEHYLDTINRFTNN